ncbi:ATP-grasp domain-containing protein [Sphingomonas sp. So64.6b]|uniref:ATP-grasp domain-containing protein n=1 Tax=Sphingomonas sp. So64.6b TaxID=2997354 RepID=UPI00160293FE|nr:ATP-grasp domain-containing protein [Sphingomonas sp. So64.6b]QNA83829.1 ATP-grasp domain-containing protein [Sphingomonas sp. So64.6b]
MSRTILLTGARAPVAVDLARSFAAAGYEVHLADSVIPWAARMSRHVRATHLLAPPRTEFAAFASGLRALAARLDPVAIVPTCEEVFYVAAAADDLDGRVLAPPLALLRMLHSKIDFAEHVRALGMTAPETWRIESRADLAAVPLDPAMLVLKPEFSRFATHTLIRPKAADLARLPLTPERPWAAQRFIAGEELCLWSFARAGRIVATVTYRPVWRHGRAAAYAFEAVECPGGLEIARTIAASGAITGHLSFDLIVTPAGMVVPIECNPRAISGLHLFDAQPALARAMLGEDADPVPTDGLGYLSPAMAMLGLPSALIGARLSDFVADWRRGHDSIGRTGDRMPVVGTVIDAARFAAKAIRARHSPTSATTDDIEWNGEAIR